MRFKQSILISVILMASCTSKKQVPVSTWLYGYGQVEKINGSVKTLIEEKFADNKMVPYFSYSFDNRGSVIRIEDIFQSGADTTKYSTVYNKSGKKTESVGLYFDRGKKIKEIYKYDNHEYLVRCIGNANNQSPDTDRFVYDKAGNLVEHQQYFQKKPLWIFKFRYLYNKNAICTGVEQSMTTWHDNFKSITKDTTRYIVFDSKNNWIKAVNFLNDTITRKITYY